MRLVEREEDIASAAAAARREAGGAFGDTALYVERVVLPARHVEVQILVDQAGRCVVARRARLLGAAPPPEGARGDARTRPR